MDLTLLILAAGVGTRYSGLKQLELIGPNQEILLDYAIYDAIKAGFTKAIFVINQKIEPSFKKSIASRYQNKIAIEYALQELDFLPKGYQVPKDRTKPWGTGHAVLCAKEFLKTPFAVINADDFYGPTSYQIMKDALTQMDRDSNEFYMVGFHLNKTLSSHGPVSRGICITQNGKLMSVVEREKIEKRGDDIVYIDSQDKSHCLDPLSLVSMTFWGFSPDVLFPFLEVSFCQFLDKFGTDLKAEFYLPSAIDKALKNRFITMKVFQTSETWFGLTFPQDKMTVQQNILKKIESNIYPARLFI